MVEATKKPHPLKGRKKSAAAIRKLKATLAEKRKLREQGLLPARKSPEPKIKRKYSKKNIDTRTHEQLLRDVNEAVWCLERSIMGKRKAIRDGRASLTDVTDEETFTYMAMRYLQGGLKP